MSVLILGRRKWLVGSRFLDQGLGPCMQSLLGVSDFVELIGLGLEEFDLFD